jgi:hypothetical protein
MMLLDYDSHYNKSMNSCFLGVEWHYRDTNSKTGSWFNVMKIFDAYGRDEIADFSLYTHRTRTPDLQKEEQLLTCSVAGKQCKSLDEFNAQTKPYMSN